MLDPLEVEQRYQQLIFRLSLPSTPADRLQVIDAFVQYCSEDVMEYDSYVRDCMCHVQRAATALRPIGQDPDELVAILERLGRVQDLVGEPSREASQALSLLRRMAALGYAYAGATDRSIALLKGVESARPAAELLAPPTEPLAPPAESSRPPVIDEIGGHDILADLRRAAHSERGSLRSKLHAEIAEIERLWPPEGRTRIGGALVPVVERPLGEIVPKRSTMRRVSVRLLAAGQDKDELRSDAVVFGIDSAGSGLSSIPVRAARDVLRRRCPSVMDRHFTGHLSFGDQQAFHEGDSAQLAIAILFVVEVLRFTNQRTRYEVRPDVAITGALDESGNVHPVDAGGIQLKVRAAFFSHVRTLVLPMAQLEQAEAERASLSNRFPRRILQLVGIKHVQDIFHDLRIIEHHKLSFPRHLAEAMWRRRKNAATIVLSSVLVLVLLFLKLAPLDKAPGRIVLAGSTLSVLNRYGEVLAGFEVGDATAARYANDPGFPRKSNALADINGDGRLEVVYLRLEANGQATNDSVVARSVTGGEVYWSRQVTCSVSFPRKGEGSSGEFGCARLLLADLNGDSLPEVVVVANQMYGFVGIVQVLDGRNGGVLGTYVHPGHIPDADVLDLEGDGIPEIIVCGGNNAYRQAFVACLGGQDIGGCGPGSEDYIPAGIPPATEKYYLLLPRTAVGKALQHISRQSLAVSVDGSRANRQINVGVNDFKGDLDSSRRDRAAAVTFAFGYDMGVIEIARGDEYDLIAQYLLDQKLIDRLPRGEDFDRYKRQITYLRRSHK